MTKSSALFLLFATIFVGTGLLVLASAPSTSPLGGSSLIAAAFASPLQASPAAPQEGEEGKKAEEADSAAADTAAADSTKSEEEEGTKFEDVIKDHEAIEGLFTIYFKEEDGSAYLELEPEQLDNVYLCSITRVSGDGTYLDSGAMSGNFAFVFRKIGKRIQWVNKNVYFHSKDDPTFDPAIERGVSNSIMASGEIEGKPHPETGAVLVKLSDFYMQDLPGIGYVLSELFKASYSFDKDNSYFSELKSFPLNTEIEVAMHFKSGKPVRTATLPDSRSFFTRYHYSLSTLPESNYVPRLSDDRVGYFTTMYQDYSDLSLDSPYVRYIDRWHLEKKNPKAKVSEPKEPIVYWLENTIPHRYREAVRNGVLMWNQAFERAGFKNAIVVKQMPDDADWDPADIRYNTVQWILVPGGGYAVGPSITNPFTGELYAADIRVSADMMRIVYKEFEEFVDPVASNAAERLMQAFGLSYDPGAQPFCNYAYGASLQASFGWSLLSMRGGFDATSRQAKEYMDDFLITVIAHEVGHTLGLRHNFMASSVHDLDALSNTRVTKEKGLTASVMDYTPVSVASQGRKQGQYWQTTPGTYDYWAIEYGYKPIPGAKTPEEELPELEKIASQVADPYHAYATDEDTWGFSPRSVDPRTNLWDLSSNQIEWYAERVGLAHELWDRIEGSFEKEGGRYQKMRRAFGQGIAECFIAGLNASKYIGGIYANRDHVGDPGGRLPFVPVPAEKQRRALAFLTEEYFSPDAFTFSPELLNKLAPNRDWDFTGSIWSMTRLDYPVHDIVLLMQSAPLNRMLDPITLGRLVDLELHYHEGEEPFTMAEMFAGIRGAIWSELGEHAPINSFRRNLQRLHLARLVTLAVNPPPGTPADATTLARADLSAILRGIQGALLSGELDPMTAAHLEESSALIEASLEAEIRRGG